MDNFRILLNLFTTVKIQNHGFQQITKICDSQNSGKDNNTSNIKVHFMYRKLEIFFSYILYV